MYHAETINAEVKLREAERQEGRVKGVSGNSGGVEPVFGLRIEERHQRRNAARKMEKMREKVDLLNAPTYSHYKPKIQRSIVFHNKMTWKQDI